MQIKARRYYYPCNSILNSIPVITPMIQAWTTNFLPVTACSHHSGSDRKIDQSLQQTWVHLVYPILEPSRSCSWLPTSWTWRPVLSWGRWIKLLGTRLTKRIVWLFWKLKCPEPFPKVCKFPAVSTQAHGKVCNVNQYQLVSLDNSFCFTPRVAWRSLR